MKVFTDAVRQLVEELGKEAMIRALGRRAQTALDRVHGMLDLVTDERAGMPLPEPMGQHDYFGRWLAEECEVGPQYEARSAELFASWSAFQARLDLSPKTIRWLSTKLQGKGFVPTRTKHARLMSGLRLRQAAGAAATSLRGDAHAH